MNIDAHKQFVLQKKVFFIKENNFFLEKCFLVLGKLFFFRFIRI